MARWSKITEYIGEDVKLAELAEKNPLAALFFTWCIPRADLYGILPGDPRAYRARIAAAMMVSTEAVQAAIDDQVEAGFIHRYEDEGKPLLYIRHYHKHQTVNWFKIKSCEYALPDCWDMPPELEDHIASGALSRTNKEWGIHGVTGIVGSKRKQTQSADGKTKQPQAGGSRGEAPPRVAKQDVDTDTDTDTENDNDLSAEPSCEAPAAPTLSLQQQLEQLRDGIPADQLALVDEFLDLCAAENKTGQIALGRRVNETRALLELREKLGPDPWAYGMDAACRKEAPNINYVKKAAASWDKEGAPPRRIKGVHPPSDFSQVKTNEYGEVID